MEQPVLCIPFSSPVLNYAQTHLAAAGISITHIPDARTSHLLLPVPSLDSSGNIRSSGSLQEFLEQVVPGTVIIGGNLSHPCLEGWDTLDLLQDAEYLWQNANITAHCALRYLLEGMDRTLPRQNILITGWGRIGKCLAKLLKPLGANITVSARKAEDRAMIRALGFRAIDCSCPDFRTDLYAAIVNTVPFPMVDGDRCRQDCFLLDLASSRGILGSRVLWARGLPGKDAPASSGTLIAETLLRRIAGKEPEA